MFRRMKWLNFMLVLGLVLLNFVGFNQSVKASQTEAAPNNTSAEDVKLKVDGMNATLSNGLLTIQFGSDGSVKSLVKNGKELVGNLNGASGDPDKHRTFYVDYHTNKVIDLVPNDFKVIKNTPEMAHIEYIDTTGILHLEYHIIMMKGESGIYSYVIAKNDNQEPANIAELRSIYRFDRNIFDHAYMSERTGEQPRYGDLEQMPKVQDETWRLPDGSVYTKYDYAGYFKENPVWGHFGNGFGAWFIPVSTEYYPGGPLKQDLLVHQDAIALNYMTGSHFGTPNLTASPGWQKMYGPWFVYINSGDNNSVVQDAQNKAREEQAKWPYQWVDESLYPLSRTTVKGHLKVADGRSASGAQVILAQPGVDPYKQTTGYIFYAQADENGNFTIPNVRPGNYSLYAYATHGTITDQLEQDNITVNGSKQDLGTINWSPDAANNYLWQLGKADRMADEFKFGNALRSYDWMNEVPADLNYTIGSSKTSEDWYYAQTQKHGSWNINFNLDKDYSGKADLKVALAAASQSPNVTVKVNGTEVNTIAINDNDQAIYRSANRSGSYHLVDIPFDASLLKQGSNTVTFTLNNGGKLMYDTVILSTDEAGSISSIRQLMDDDRVNNEIQNPIDVQLTNALNQAETALNQGKQQEAIKHMEDFVKHLDNPAMQKFINNDAKEMLHTDAASLLKSWK